MLIALCSLLLAVADAHNPCAIEKEEEPTLEQRIKDATVQVGFVIAKSTTSYTEALALAKNAASALRLPLQLRELVPNEKTGLTDPREVCEREIGEYPCYLARGRFDSGAYVSIEHSNAYPEFKANLFIVVLASAGKNGAMLWTVVQKARKRFSDSYLRTAPVYMGCMH